MNWLYKWIPALVLSAAFHAEAAPPQPAEDQAAITRSQSEIDNLLTKTKSETPPNCEATSARWATIQSAANTIYLRGALWGDYARAAAASPKLSQYYRAFSNEFLGTAVRTRLDIADVALSLKCYDVADVHYRYVIANFTDPIWSAYRERAKVGVDDVRARKQ